MPPGEINLDAFLSWLCAREHEVVGSFGRCYDSPLLAICQRSRVM